MLISATAVAGLSPSHELCVIPPDCSLLFTLHSVKVSTMLLLPVILVVRTEAKPSLLHGHVEDEIPRGVIFCSCVFATYVEDEAQFGIISVVYTQPWIPQPLQ